MIIRPGGAADRDAVADLFSAISAESFYQRFQTARGPAPSPALLDRLLPVRPDAGSLLVFDGCRQLVAHGMWVRVDVPRAAEIALVVTDSLQRQGIGTMLVRALTDELARRGIEQAQAVSSPGNRAVRRMLARAVPTAAASYEQGLTTWTFSTSRLPDAAVA